MALPQCIVIVVIPFPRRLIALLCFVNKVEAENMTLCRVPHLLSLESFTKHIKDHFTTIPRTRGKNNTSLNLRGDRRMSCKISAIKFFKGPRDS